MPHNKGFATMRGKHTTHFGIKTIYFGKHYGQIGIIIIGMRRIDLFQHIAHISCNNAHIFCRAPHMGVNIAMTATTMMVMLMSTIAMSAIKQVNTRR